MREQPLYPVVRTHLDAISDSIGILQHASGRTPDPAHGYCVDDVARALQLDLRHARQVGWRRVEPDAERALRFLTAAFDVSTGRFRNFRRIDGSWDPAVASQDCQGRAIHALGDAAMNGGSASFRDRARASFERAMPGVGGVRALRALSSIALGCRSAIRAGSSRRVEDVFAQVTDRLWGMFRPCTDDAWPWPETALTYENALPARALIVAGRHHGLDPAVRSGLRTLEWLVRVQTTPAGSLSPIGNGWWPRTGTRSRFDQQPIEAASLILAASDALSETHDMRWARVMERAYGWFLGDNDIGLRVSDPVTGGCHDGLTPVGVNANQGAESTLMWLIALECIRDLRTGATASASSRPLAAVVA